MFFYWFSLQKVTSAIEEDMTYQQISKTTSFLFLVIMLRYALILMVHKAVTYF